MIEENVARTRIEEVERSLRRTRIALYAIAGLLVVVLGAGWRDAGQDPQVIKARGLVIVDSEGKERIVLGAPASAISKGVQKGAGCSIVLLDADGRARLLVGENTAFVRDGRTHARERGYAVLVHDAKGDERGGFGCFDGGKTVIALDRKSPEADGIGMMVDDSIDWAGLAVYHKLREGNHVQAMALGVQKGGCYLNMDDRSGNRRMSFELPPDGDPQLQLFDTAGKLQRDALESRPVR
jgi:hypothetical protein